MSNAKITSKTINLQIVGWADEQEGTKGKKVENRHMQRLPGKPEEFLPAVPHSTGSVGKC